MSIEPSLAEKLERVGLQVDPYQRGPAGKDNFAISLDGDRVRLWQGQADVTVRTNQRKRQVLINVIERPRLVKTKSRFDFYWRPKEPKTLEGAIHFVATQRGRHAIKEAASLTVPNATMRITAFKFSKGEYDGARIDFDVEFRTRTTKTSFLVGYDESNAERPFICQLRSFVDSFEEAYADLLPKNVRLKQGYKRHGEWFLNPVSQQLNTELCANVHRGVPDCPLDGQYQPWRGVNNHRGFVLRYQGKRYVLGRVYDTRQGRHGDLTLTSWHEIIRNNEVANTQKRRQTWD